MTRQIKFRGLRTDGNGWVYGDLKRVNDNRRGGQWYYIWVDTHDIEDEGIEHRVEWQSIGQFTGLKDKNGTEIYEGDKVRGHTSYNCSLEFEGIIVFTNQMFCVKQVFEKITIYTALFQMYQLEVIGSIHTTHDKEKGGSCQ